MKNLILTIIVLTVFGQLRAQNVGIGTTTPAYPLTVISNGANAGLLQKSGAVELGFYTDAGLGHAFLQTYSQHTLDFAVGNGSSKLKIAYPSGYVGISLGTKLPTAQLDVSGTLRIRDNGAAAGRSLVGDAEGYASWQPPIALKAGVGGNSISINSTKAVINFGSKSIETQPGLFDLGTDAFTAPVAGVYQVTASLYLGSSQASDLTMYIDKAGVTMIAAQHDMAANSVRTCTLSGLVELNAGDKLTFSAQLSAGFANLVNSVSNFMCISLVR